MFLNSSSPILARYMLTLEMGMGVWMLHSLTNYHVGLDIPPFYACIGNLSHHTIS